MIILHVITGLNDGGAEGALYRLCKNDKDNSHIVVSLLNGGKYEHKFKLINISTYSLKLNTTYGSLTCLYNFKKILNEIKPNVIQTWLYHADLFGGICAFIFGYRNIYWNIRNCNTSKKALKTTTRIVVYINSLLSHFIPKHIVSVSQNASLHHIKIGYQKDKFINIPNGYEFTESIMNLDYLESLKNKSSFLIGMVARYDPQKDHSNLLKSLLILKENKIVFHCLLVGTGMDNSNSYLVNEINKLNLNNYITLLGRRDDINNIMRILDLHVLSSLGEAFPNVLVEAMSNETLCVSTDVGDASYIIGDFGWIVKPECPKNLANAILEANNIFLNNRNDWKKLCFLAKDFVVTRFSIEKMINNYSKMWNG
jgi:glycosyltransferase involved in cell wall biosynthesis